MSDRLDLLAHDAVATSGGLVYVLLACPEAMAWLDTHFVEPGFSQITLGDMVRCARTELDAYTNEWKRQEAERLSTEETASDGDKSSTGPGSPTASPMAGTAWWSYT